MEQILKDKQLNSAYHNKGFVKFPLFDAMQISEIKEFYNYIRERHNAKKNNAFHTTLNTSDSNIINKVNDFLMSYFKREVKKHLVNYNLTISVFLTKDTGKDSSVTIHQDSSFVDETKHTAFGLWVALDNTNVLNGCMQFIPGSHKFYPSLRISPDLPPYFYSFKDAAVDYLVDVPSKAGECVMFNQAIIHASRKNFSHKQRVACVTGGYSKNAEFTHHFLPKGNPLSKIEKYKI
ncbi:MAG: phytanoyl-CoA dioxygenase family protein, partial [Candidatus Paceibacterota bacterium]